PPHQKQAEENRLREKREAFQRKWHSNDRAGLFHESWPKQTELERQHRSRNRTLCKKKGGAVGPSLSQFQKYRAASAKITRFRNGHQHRQANSDCGKHD